MSIFLENFVLKYKKIHDIQLHSSQEHEVGCGTLQLF